MKKITIALCALMFASYLPAQSTAEKKDASAVEVKKDGDKKKKKKGKGDVKEEKKEEDKFADITKKCKKSEGLFNIYRDTVSGKTYLEVKAAQLEKEFIYFNHIADAPTEAGYFRGSYGDSKIVRFQKNYERIDVVQENTNFYFDPASELSKAANANINDPMLISEKIEATSKDKSNFLIDGDAIFLSEKFELVKYQSPQGMPPSPLGSLSSSKSRVNEINNYPANTDVLVSYVYENSNPNAFSDALLDARNITIKYQHSIMEVPNTNFQARKDDARVGYFSTQVNDMTSFEAANYKDVIHRWNLEKKDPNARLSDPIEPITYWIENTTPKELRPIIKQACERWNMAFEKAGFTNAVVCLEQPDSATWDAGDIRYNMLRWTSSPQPPFGGYGPSFVNPRTGQILGADIMLEFVALVNRVNADKVFKTGAMLTDDKLELMRSQNIRNPFFCSASEMTNNQLIFGSAAAASMNMDRAVRQEIVKQLLFRLVLHEVGHTLGLTHNMRASTLSTMADVKNPEKVLRDGLSNSVMEYPAFNFQADPKQQTLYCDVQPGPYDKWVIEYGYSPAMKDPMAEEFRLSRILEHSSEPQLAYGNDADDMRASGRGYDPDVNIYDLTNDPVAYGAERCDLVNLILPKLKDKYTTNGKSYEELLQAYLIATGEYATQVRVMTRQIGGVHYDRSFVGQETKNRPFEAVSEVKQKEAMAALAKYAFAPDVLSSASGLYNYLLEQRRGFSHGGNNEDPHIHSRILAMQAECLNHLLHPNVLQRVTDSKMYGNTYSLDKYMTDLTNSIFAADAKIAVNTMRQNIQVEYVERLVAMLDPKGKYDNVAQGMALYELKRIEMLEATGTSAEGLTKAHREHVKYLINQALEQK